MHPDGDCTCLQSIAAWLALALALALSSGRILKRTAHPGAQNGAAQPAAAREHARRPATTR